MAFAQTRNKHRMPMGDNYFVYGTFTNTDGDTGGTIDTGLHLVKHFDLQHTGNAAVDESPSVNEVLPSDGSIVIVTTANACGIWSALGA